MDRSLWPFLATMLLSTVFILILGISMFYFARRSLGVTSETLVSCSTCKNCARSTNGKCICKQGYTGRECDQLTQTTQFAKLEIPSNMQSYRDIPLQPGQCRSLCSSDRECLAFSYANTGTDGSENICRLYSSWDPISSGSTNGSTSEANMANTFIKRDAPLSKINHVLVYADPISRLSTGATAVVPNNETTKINFRPTIIEGGDALLSDRPFNHSYNTILAQIAPSKHLYVLRQGVTNDPPLAWVNRPLYISPI